MTSKYDRLADHLAAIGAATITLSVAEVERVIGPLPVQARRNVQWWGAQGSSHYLYPHARAWWQAGYVADRPDFAAQTVTFRRLVL